MKLPLIAHHVADPPSRLRSDVMRYAVRLRRQRPEIVGEDGLGHLRATALDEGPALLLDDQSRTPVLENGRCLAFRQDMARLRAADGDLLASCLPPTEGFEDYCRNYLNLGAVEWLTPVRGGDRAQVAAALWQDAYTRATLTSAVHRGRLQIHPHRGLASVWQLAALLDEEARDRVTVLAPLPKLTAWTNDKLQFCRLVGELFGSRFVPTTYSTGNLALAAPRVRQLAATSEKIVLKLPGSVGGGGNRVFDAAEFRGLTLTEIHTRLREAFRNLRWSGETELLVSCWEMNVQCAPSAQLWIPPDRAQPPMVEGLFEQSFTGECGIFVGHRRAAFDAELEQEIVDRCWLLGSLFQELGYVGRCSIDMLLVDGGGSGTRKLEFLECNGRWGGTSTPMTLMNRLFGDWHSQPYVFQEYDRLDLEHVPFPALVSALHENVYDVRTGQGRLIFINPARMQARGGVSVLALADSWESTRAPLGDELPLRLKQIHADRARSSRPSSILPTAWAASLAAPVG